MGQISTPLIIYYYSHNHHFFFFTISFQNFHVLVSSRVLPDPHFLSFCVSEDLFTVWDRVFCVVYKSRLCWKETLVETFVCNSGPPFPSPTPWSYSVFVSVLLSIQQLQFLITKKSHIFDSLSFLLFIMYITGVQLKDLSKFYYSVY